MSSSNNRVLNVYKSRRNLLDILSVYEYNISDYDTFSINEVDSMFAHSQLDMFIKGPNNNIYIKYFISNAPAKPMRTQSLDDIIEDLYYTENVLNKKDTLIVVVDTEPNETMIDKLNYLYDHDGIFVVMYNIKRLLFNILNHERVPHIAILDETQTKNMMDQYNVKNTNQLPEISRYDPLAMAACMRPGQVCQLVRKSPTALNSTYYRVCK